MKYEKIVTKIQSALNWSVGRNEAWNRNITVSRISSFDKGTWNINISPFQTLFTFIYFQHTFVRRILTWASECLRREPLPVLIVFPVRARDFLPFEILGMVTLDYITFYTYLLSRLPFGLLKTKILYFWKSNLKYLMVIDFKNYGQRATLDWTDRMTNSCK